MADQAPAPNQAMIEKLPSELVQEILSRLPIDSVFESRFVSSKFRKLINHHRFPKMHYNQSIRKQNSHQSGALLTGNSDFHYTPNFRCEKVIEIHGNYLPFKSFLQYFNMVGSVNGFLCLENHSGGCIPTQGVKTPFVVIYNPVTGDMLKLPEIPKLSKGTHNFFGFGYCSESNQYKVLRMGVEENTGNSAAEIITVGHDSWRSIGTFTNLASITVKSVHNQELLTVNCHGVFLNGYIHWLMQYNRKMTPGIRAFDVENECFEMVPFPDSIDDKEIRILICMGLLELGVLDGCLMLIDNSKNDAQEVWIRKKSGVKESWVLEYVIPNSHFLHPLGVLENGKILTYKTKHSDFTFYVYDPENGTVEKLRVPGRTKSRYGLVLHVGTLVSPKDVIADFNQSKRNL